jgi:trehalose/maltose hydrolase-like predicted phosphorylase
MRMSDKSLEFSPNLPSRYKGIEFHVFYRGNLFKVRCEKKKVQITQVENSGQPVKISGNRILAA